MIFLLSPAKTLDFESASLTDVTTNAAFLKYSKTLIKHLKTLSVRDVQNLMGVSEKIAALNVQRYKDWKTPFTLQNSKQAVFAFKGDVYTGLNVETMDEDGLQYLQQHLLILSGLYGILKPMDLIQAYRLEMGIKLAAPEAADLYTYWDDKLTKKLNTLLEKEETPVLVNLASIEYFKAIQAKSVSTKIVTPVFKDMKNGEYKMISFFAKKARGLMLRYASDNLISEVEELKQFNYAGYRYSADRSNDTKWVFLREQIEK